MREARSSGRIRWFYESCSFRTLTHEPRSSNSRDAAAFPKLSYNAAMSQSWNPAEYARHGRFVADLAEGVFALLGPKAGEKILDLGCGDGALTERIVEAGADVVAVDSSAEMIEAARLRGLNAHVVNGDALPFSAEFDAVFSNAALHWMLDQGAVLAGVRRALVPGGRFAAEMGGHGNIAAIRVALRAASVPYGIDSESAGSNVFYSPEEYAALLEGLGFSVEQMQLVPRPTLLPGGIGAWIQTFRRGLLDQIPPAARDNLIEEVTSLLQPILADRAGRWHADYVRLRFLARI